MISVFNSIEKRRELLHRIIEDGVKVRMRSLEYFQREEVRLQDSLTSPMELRYNPQNPREYDGI